MERSEDVTDGLISFCARRVTFNGTGALFGRGYLTRELDGSPVLQVGQGRLVLGGGVFGRILILRASGSLRAMLSSELNSVPAVIALRMNGTLEALAAILLLGA